LFKRNERAERRFKTINLIPILVKRETRMKKRLLPLVMLFAFLGFNSVSHASTWVFAKVVLAGKTPQGTYLRLEHATFGGELVFPSTRFKVDETMDNEILAIGMASIASNKLILVETTQDEVAGTEEQPMIRAAYLSNKPITD
jgi:hypothetical protein